MLGGWRIAKQKKLPAEAESNVLFRKTRVKTLWLYNTTIFTVCQLFFQLFSKKTQNGHSVGTVGMTALRVRFFFKAV